MNNFISLAAGLAEDESAEAAAALTELEPSSIVAFLTILSDYQAPQILAELPTPIAAACLELLPARRSAIWLQAIGYPLKTRIARSMSSDALLRTLAEMPKSTAHQINRDITYLPDSVGAWMEEAACVIREDDTVGDSLARLRRQKKPLEHTLVMTGRGGKYIGLVSLGTLVKASEKLLVGRFADRSIPALNPNTALIEIADRGEWSTHLLLPVSGVRGSFLGVLKVERLRSALNYEVDSGTVSGSVLFGYLLDAALVSAAGMARMFPRTGDLTELEEDGEA